MPATCRQYDCKKYRFYFGCKWDGKEWVPTSLHEKLATEADKEFIDKYNALFKDK